MPPKVLVSDKLSSAALDIFKERGITAHLKTDLSKDELAKIIPAYDGLAVRSATKVTAKLLSIAKNLKVVGRAGIGVDNIDIPAASQNGVIVMNAPMGNAVTTAEHAIALLMTLARHIPDANLSTQAGKWEKSRFMGVEIADKTLGIIGCGNIGAIVAQRAQGLAMNVIAHDPFLSLSRAADLGVEKTELNELLQRADFITLHTPLTPKTRNIINAAAIAKMKKGALIVNCARGGLVNEADLKDALISGHIAGAALDVFENEPPKDNPLFGAPNLICTPHLGASTTEAQEKVALQIARQMSNYLLTGAVVHAINMPSISAEEAPRLKPFIRLAELLGLFAGQMLRDPITGVNLEYGGQIADMNTAPITSAALAGLLKTVLSEINMISAPAVARQRGVQITEVKREKRGAYDSYIRLTLKTEDGSQSVAGTVFSDGRPRLIQIGGLDMEAELGTHMIYIANKDEPGFIGALGQLLGKNNLNIACFHLGRKKTGGEAVALVETDAPPSPQVVKDVRELRHVVHAVALNF